jgi:hypothetical protein
MRELRKDAAFMAQVGDGGWRRGVLGVQGGSKSQRTWGFKFMTAAGSCAGTTSPWHKMGGVQIRAGRSRRRVRRSQCGWAPGAGC